MKCSLRCTAKWFSFIYTCILASHLSQLLKNHPAMKEIWVQSLGLGRYAQRVMTSHSSILAWRISWTEEPSRLQSTGSQRVGHIWSNGACTGAYIWLFLYKFVFHLCCYRMSDRVVCGFVVGPCWLSILYIVVSIYMLVPNSKFIPPPNLPFGNH